MEASIFYPVDKTFDDSDADVIAEARMLNKAIWTEDENRTMGNMGKGFGKTFLKVEKAPKVILRFFATRQLPALIDADLAYRFSSGDEELRPLVFSHGLSAMKCMYSAVYHKMAANGHLVIAINHQDESCVHTVDRYGKDIYYYRTGYFDEEYRQRQLKIRTDEVVKVVDELPQIHESLDDGFLGPKVKVDMQRLILAGQSFGGATMISAANALHESGR